MKPFIFSADAHVNEPKGLWQDQLPASMKDYALRTSRDDTYFYTMCGERVLHRMQLADGNSGNEKIGRYEIEPRVQDMVRDGVDAELIFPQLGMMASCVDNRDIEVATTKIYNDWCIGHFKSHPHMFVPAAVLPVQNLADTLAELNRVIGLGYTTAMVPCVLPEATPKLNRADWDPIWQAASDAGMPIIFHVGTGPSRVFEKGPGAAILNYLAVSQHAIDCVAFMVTGGALDRFPKLQIVTVEAGASYLLSLAERMDETYRQMQHYIRPKLSRLPSRILADQVKATFQRDRAAIRSRHVLGHQTMLFASDYPHAEGTFPNTQAVVEENFGGLDVPQAEMLDILGRTAAKLFRLKNAAVAAA
ncbi:MAG: amidohydrolase family protein [Gammaproteobacteria bacterium]